jgi:nitrate/nitrite transporter NarK
MITYLDRVCFGTVAPYIQAEFGLSDTQLGYLFTAFALAYALFEVPSGWLGDVFGARGTLIRIVLWWSFFTALTGLVSPLWFPGTVWLPLLGTSSTALLAMIAVRFLFGMGEAGAYPNISRAFHSWFPFSERGSAQGAVWMAGRFAGGITPLVVLALVYRTQYLPAVVDRATALAGAAAIGGGWNSLGCVALTAGQVVHWQHIFWIFGAIGVTWCIAFWWWFRDQPEEHPSVNAAELAHIRAGTVPGHDSHAGVPWRKILSSGNLWVLCAMYFCASYGWYFNITWLPKFLKSYYKVEQETYGFWAVSLLAGAPLLFGSLACLVGGLLTDAFIKRTGNRKWGRRLFGVVGHSLCAVCYGLGLLAFLFLDRNHAASPWLFVLGVALASFWNDLTMGAAWASCIDIGKRYSGTVAGFMNMIGNLGGAAAGYITGWILDAGKAARSGEAGQTLGWQINLASFALVYVVAVFCWLGFDASRPIVPEKEGSAGR